MKVQECRRERWISNSQEVILANQHNICNDLHEVSVVGEYIAAKSVAVESGIAQLRRDYAGASSDEEDGDDDSDVGVDGDGDCREGVVDGDAGPAQDDPDRNICEQKDFISISDWKFDAEHENGQEMRITCSRHCCPDDEDERTKHSRSA